MTRYRKRPVEIEAVQFEGTTTSMVAIQHWMSGSDYFRPEVQTRDYRTMEIETLEGTMIANPRDWIIKGVQGEFYPCKPDIFEATYEEVTDELPEDV